MNSIEQRNYIGYGPNPPYKKWPGNARIAISFVLNYEEGGERCVADGDPTSEVFLNETPGGVPRKERDPNMETQYEYGSRCGVYRILRLFDKYSFKFTCYAVGRAVEKNPAVIQEMKKRGHEIGSHNHKWIDYATVTEEETRQDVRDCIKAIQSAIGQPPTGWYTGRIGPQTRRIVLDECRKQGVVLKWESDAYNDDLPYFVTVDGHQQLILPYTLDQNDMKFCVPPGFTSPDGFYDYLKSAFDVLYEEGQDAPKFMSIGLHCRLVGKPGRAKALDRFMEYISKHPGVWVATREQVADFWTRN